MVEWSNRKRAWRGIERLESRAYLAITGLVGTLVRPSDSLDAHDDPAIIVSFDATTRADPVLQSIAVTPANPSVAKGLTQQFTATGTFSDNSTQNLTAQVTWASATTAVATISASGLATAVATGTSTISASLNGVLGSTVLTVTSAALQSIAVTPANPSVHKGLAQQFTATGTYSDNSIKDLTSQVTWASATTSVATISAAGLATAVATGTSTISAALSGISGSTVLTVTAPVLQSIAVTPANPSVPRGLTQQFTATGTFSDSSTQNLTAQVTWASATTSVATISASGLATAVAAGTSTISASLGGVSGSTVLTVTAAVLQSIAVTPANPSVAKGLTRQFTATGTFSDNSVQDLTAQVIWASATASVASISANGLATALATGTSSISATLNGITGSTVLTVTAAILQSIAATPANPSIAKGLTQQFTATGTYTDHSTQNLTSSVTWASATTSVATISASGLATAVATGTSTISATLGGVSGSTVFTVTPPAGPSVTSAQFVWNNSPQRIEISFDQDVSASLSAADLVLENLTKGGAIPSGNIVLNWNAVTRTATFTFPSLPNGGSLPDGNYTATLLAAGVNNSSGMHLGTDYVLPFFQLAGDANHDRTVNVSDLGILATNWQGTGKTFGQGDFNYDGKVDVSDLGMFATNWQKSLSAPPAAAAQSGMPNVRDATRRSLADDLLARNDRVDEPARFGVLAAAGLSLAVDRHPKI